MFELRAPRFGRRHALIGAALALGAAPAVAPGAAPGMIQLADMGPAPAAPRILPEAAAAWALFKTRFLAPEGRIIDTANGGVSHSEGQSWGLLLAVRHDDRPAFDLILAWTRRYLAVRPDALLAWRFRPGIGVDDPNNASDADLYFAWALIEAHRRWREPEHAALARRVAAHIVQVLVRPYWGHQVLLPGAQGFQHRAHIELNPSYYIFPAIRALAEFAPDPAWPALIEHGRLLLDQARFGRWRLPADWLSCSLASGTMAPEPRRGDRFGYDAIRVPLNAVWGGMGSAGLEGPAGFWSDRGHPQVPAWTVLSSGAVSPYRAGAGVLAIASLTMAARSGWAPEASAPAVARAEQYYDAALCLLADQARADIVRAGTLHVARAGAACPEPRRAAVRPASARSGCA